MRRTTRHDFRPLTAKLLTGRKEILTFFYLYALIELLAIFLDTNIIPSANEAYVVRDAR